MAPEIEGWDNASTIRNVVILAHVDHDSLLAHQGLISSFQAGQLRYLDSLPDEQRRGITMKSSSFVTTYKPVSSRLYPPDKMAFIRAINSILPRLDALSLNGNGAAAQEQLFLEEGKAFSKEREEERVLIHLIDTPGHVDFYGQVYTSSLLADGAIIVIDVVEGICAQTLAAFRLAHEVNLAPVVFLNKIDRLIHELSMSCTEIYSHLSNIIESVNAACSAFRKTQPEERSIRAKSDPKSENETGDEDDVFYFDPRKGNVVFGSAIDGWAFRLSIFANLFSKKIPSLSRGLLNASLWGPYFLSKKKQVKRISGDETPMFVSLILENIVAVYRANGEKIANICSTFSLPSISNVSKVDRRNVIRTIFKSWIPLSSSLLDTIVDTLPNPLLRTIHDECSHFYQHQCNKEHRQQTDGEACDSRPHRWVGDTVAAIVAKPLIYPELTEDILKIGVEKWREKNASAFEDIVMMCRLAEGEISSDSTLFFSSPYALDANGNKIENYSFKLEEFSLFQLMASKLCPVKRVPKGHIFGISGIMRPSLFVKCGVLSSAPHLYPLHDNSLSPGSRNDFGYFPCSKPSSRSADSCSFTMQSSSVSLPLVSVACEPADSLKNLSTLQYAMLVLYQIDPSVGVVFSDRGEFILEACGDLHLEKAVNELQSLVDFPISISSSIIPLGETISDQRDRDMNISKNSTFFRDFDSIDYTFISEDVGKDGGMFLTEDLVSVELSLHVLEGVVPSLLSWAGDIDPKVCDACQKAFNIAVAMGPLCGEKVYSVRMKIHSIAVEYGEEEDTDVLITPLRKIFHMALLLSGARLIQGYNEISILVSSSICSLF